LQCNQDFLQLRYCLNTDKQTPISVQSDEEFEIFMDRMRSLHVPAKLANGKMSTQTLKPVTISFEDGSDWDNATSARTSQSGGNKVCSTVQYVSVHPVILRNP